MRSDLQAPTSLARICRQLQSAELGERLVPYVVVVWIGMALCSYRLVLGDLFDQWQSNPNYSHGAIVIPIALWLLWHRRSTFPDVSKPWNAGIGLLFAAHFLLWLGAYFYLPAIQRWTIPLWLCGTIGLLWGHRVLVWSLPGVCFLAFMIPLPFQLESLASQLFQWASAWCSCLLLGLTSTFAVTDGYTLRMATGRLQVSADCSGLRMTVAIAALSYVITALSHDRTRTNRRSGMASPGLALHLGVMMLLVVPTAIVANAARITVMAFVMHRYRIESYTGWAHDLGDWFVLPVSAALFLTLRSWLGSAHHIWQSEILRRQLNHIRSNTRCRWTERIMPVLRIATGPVALVVLIGASIWHHASQREQIAVQIMTPQLAATKPKPTGRVLGPVTVSWCICSRHRKTRVTGMSGFHFRPPMV